MLLVGRLEGHPLCNKPVSIGSVLEHGEKSPGSLENDHYYGVYICFCMKCIFIPRNTSWVKTKTRCRFNST